MQVEPVRQLQHADGFQRLQGRGMGLVSLDVEAGHRDAEHHDLQRCERERQRAGLRHYGAASRQGRGGQEGNRLAVQQHLSACGPELSTQETKQCGLAGSVGSDDSDELSRCDVEVDSGDQGGALHPVGGGVGDDGRLRHRVAW